MLGNDSLADAQAEAGALVLAFGGEKRLEQPCLDVTRHPATVVFDAEHQVIFALPATEQADAAPASRFFA
jgi:hypothetical protein